MKNWRGARSTSSAGQTARIRQQRWSDPRLVLGVLLVLVATVLGAYLVALGDETEGYWAVGRDVAAGEPVQRSDLVETRAQANDEAAAVLQRTDEPLPAELGDLIWSRAVSAGALLDRSALARSGSSGATEMPLVVRIGAGPDDLRAGEQVDVWVGPSPEDAGSGPARLVLEGVSVSNAGSVRGSGGTRTVLVDVQGVDLDGEVVAALTSRHVTIVRQP